MLSFGVISQQYSPRRRRRHVLIAHPDNAQLAVRPDPVIKGTNHVMEVMNARDDAISGVVTSVQHSIPTNATK